MLDATTLDFGYVRGEGGSTAHWTGGFGMGAPRSQWARLRSPSITEENLWNWGHLTLAQQPALSMRCCTTPTAPLPVPLLLLRSLYYSYCSAPCTTPTAPLPGTPGARAPNSGGTRRTLRHVIGEAKTRKGAVPAAPATTK
eukprot:gene15405-biopygen1983